MSDPRTMDTDSADQLKAGPTQNVNDVIGFVDSVKNLTEYTRSVYDDLQSSTWRPHPPPNTGLIVI